MKASDKILFDYTDGRFDYDPEKYERYFKTLEGTKVRVSMQDRKRGLTGTMDGKIYGGSISNRIGLIQPRQVIYIPTSQIEYITEVI